VRLPALNVYRIWRILIISRMFTGSTNCFFTLQAPFFRRLGVRHVGTINAKHAATVNGTFETAKGTVDGFVVTNFYAYRQIDSS